MIKLQDFTPRVYYRESRDFQLLGRLFDLVLNAVKTDATAVASVPFSDNVPDKFLELYAQTIGLQLHTTRYTSAHLRAVCSVFPELLRTKGSLHSITVLCNALLSAEGITEPVEIALVSNTLRISIPNAYVYTALLEDLLNYILPAGLGYTIIRNVDKYVPTTSDFYITQSVRYKKDASAANGLFKIEHGDAAKNNLLFANNAGSLVSVHPGFNVNSEQYTKTGTSEGETQ
jgi:hypothetical protein